MTVDFMLLCVTPLDLLVLGDVLSLRVVLFMFTCPISCWVMAGTAPSPTLCFGHRSRKPQCQPCGASPPFWGIFPWEGPCPSLFCCLGCRWGGCPGAALVPSCTTRTGLDIPQPFLFPFRDLITEESLNLLIVIRTCVFGSFPYSLTSFTVSAKPPLPSHS